MKDWKYAVSSAEDAPSTAPILFCGDICANMQAAGKLGYSAIEVHIRETAEIDYEAIAKIQMESGTKIGMIITGRLNTEGKVNLIDDIPYITDAAIEGMKKYIDIASKLDADIVVGWIKGNIPNGGIRKKYMNRLAYNLKILAEYGKDKNVKLNLEVINRYEVNVFTTCREIVDFLDEFDLDNCYVHLDTFHMNIDETNPVEAIQLAGKRLGYFHLADNSRRYPGSGQLDFVKIIKTLEDIGYNGYLSVECLPYPSGEEAAERAITYLKSLKY